MSVQRMSHWANSEGCYFKDDPNGELIFYEDYERLREALEDAWDRMDRARNIITGGNPREHNNWGMLDTSADRKALEVKP